MIGLVGDWISRETLGQDLAIIGTLIVLEAVLSFDNAAVLAAMVRRLPPKDRRKALLYGLVGAYTLRIAAIFLASFLIRTPILKVLGGGYLIFIAAKHFISLRRHQKQEGTEEHVPGPGGWLERLGVPALVAVIIQVELVDLAFAIDQVVAAVAFTDKISLVIAASVLGILFLRLAAGVMARVMDWLPILEHMAYIAVTVVGFKLMLEYPPIFAPNGHCIIPGLAGDASHGAGDHCEVPVPIAISITLGLFGVPVLLKLLFGIPKPRGS
ncbi:MAG TPA: DUF475 domain-containing protein [Candidatus Thermoplasmatota archaeon]|nr:DUF475 domain-containing protein [Candidatus Thermoplasmatota archaeon]